MELNGTLPKRYLTVDEVAAYLGLSKNAIYRLVDARGIPFSKPGGLEALRFDIKAVDKWMERQQVPPRPAA
jgi:excisionase family DNA binding protein